MEASSAAGHRRVAMFLERPPTMVKVLCAICGFALALEALVIGFAFLDSGGKTISAGKAAVGTCGRDLTTGWVMYRCTLVGEGGAPISTGMPGSDKLRIFKRPQGDVDFEIRKSAGAKGTKSHVIVKKGAARHPGWLQLLLVPLFLLVFGSVFLVLLRILRLIAKLVARPAGDLTT